MIVGGQSDLLQLGFLEGMDFPIWSKVYPGKDSRQRIFREDNVSFSGQASLMEEEDPSDS